MPNQKNNPVLKTIHGVKVRRYNYLSIMYPQGEFEELINQSADTGLPIPMLIAIKSKPCQVCKCDNVTLTIKKDGRSNKQNNDQTIVSKNNK